MYNLIIYELCIAVLYCMKYWVTRIEIDKHNTALTYYYYNNKTIIIIIIIIITNIIIIWNSRLAHLLYNIVWCNACCFIICGSCHEYIILARWTACVDLYILVVTRTTQNNNNNTLTLQKMIIVLYYYYYYSGRCVRDDLVVILERGSLKVRRKKNNII